ncbi:MAG TPA: hypothetical protein VJU78_12030 [Chitinophagaceae bacterium]|nr:hypothetical protein [Chitinophagaceae bacterium]
MISPAVNKEKDNQARVAEIINYQPGWIIRNGNLLFLCFFLLLIGVSFFINYPEVITVPGQWIQDSATKKDVPGKEKEIFNGYITVHKSLRGKIKPGDRVVINSGNDQTGNLKSEGTVATISDHPGSKDSAILFVSMNGNAGINKKIISPNNIITASIRTRGQKLSYYLWRELKGLFKTRD